MIFSSSFLFLQALTHWALWKNNALQLANQHACFIGYKKMPYFNWIFVVQVNIHLKTVCSCPESSISHKKKYIKNKVSLVKQFRHLDSASCSS